MDIQLKELISLSYNFSYYCRFSWRFSGRSFEHAATTLVFGADQGHHRQERRGVKQPDRALMPRLIPSAHAISLAAAAVLSALAPPSRSPTARSASAFCASL